jgi:4-carboxymuconolactone decarboxylase
VAGSKLKSRLEIRWEASVKPTRFLIGLLLIGAGVAAGHSLPAFPAQSAASLPAKQPQTAAAAFPKDVFAETGNRLPAIKRDDLDDAGKKLYDSRGPVDSYGPGAIRLYSQPVAEHMAAVNDYLRNKAGLDQRLVQLAILVTARENNSEYVWTAHEPQGLKAGLPPEVIDAVRYRKSVDGLSEKDAVIIQLARGAVGKHHVDSDVAAHAMRLFGKQGMVNYVALMGDYAATTVLLNAFDQHIRPADKARMPIP